MFSLQRLPHPRHPHFPYTTLFRSLHDEDAAEEVVGDVFVKVWRHVHKHDPSRGPLVPWILSIARNRALDELRRRSSRSEEHTSELQSLRHLVCRLLLEKKENEY